MSFRVLVSAVSFLLLGAVACGATTSAGSSCGVTIDSYCANHACPTTTRAWCTSNDVFSTGTCSGGRSVVTTATSVDQSDDYVYDVDGKLVAILGWVSDAPCSGACRYVCTAGPPDLEPSTFHTSCTTTWYPSREKDGGVTPMPSCSSP